MNFLILYLNQYKNLKKYKQKKIRIFQISFLLLVSGISGVQGTESEYTYGEAFYDRIKGLSDNVDQFDSTHYYFQSLVPPIESNILEHGSEDLIICNVFVQDERGETSNLDLDTSAEIYTNERCEVKIKVQRGSIVEVIFNTRDIDLRGFRINPKWNIMQPSFDSLDDLKEKVRSGNIYGYREEKWFDESTGLSFTVQNNIRRNIKVLSMALCFNEDELTTDIYFDVCLKENNIEFFEPIKKSITTLHDELPSSSNFPKDIYVIKNGDTISKLKKEGKRREIFKNQSGSNVRSLWIKNNSFQKRVKNNEIIYISTQLPSQYRYGEPDIDFKGLLIEGNVEKGQYFFLNGKIEDSYSKTYLYKKADKHLFFVKLNKGRIKYTDSTDLEWNSSQKIDIEYLTKDRPLVGASQTGSHNIEGFYQINRRTIGQIQNWLIFKDETNSSTLFSTEFPCISISDFSPDTFKNDQKKDEEIAFINFLSDWDLVQSLSLIFSIEVNTKFTDHGLYFNGGIEISRIENSPSKRFLKILQKELKGKTLNKISVIKLPYVDFNVWRHFPSSSHWGTPGTIRFYQEKSVELLNDLFQSLKRFSELREIDFEFLYPIQEKAWIRTNGSMYYNVSAPITSGLKDLFSSLTNLKILKIDYPTYDMIKDDSDLVKRLKNLKLYLYNTPPDETLKQTVKNTFGQGEVIFEKDLPPPASCIIS